jgi:tetratricopeptide (TPR) repeat protein
MNKSSVRRNGLLALTVVSLLAVYLFARTTKSDRSAEEMPLTTNELPELNEDTYLMELRMSLGKNDTLDLIDQAEKSGEFLLAASLYDSLQQPLAAAVFRGKAAEKSGSDSLLLVAGDGFYDLLSFIKDKSIRLFVAQEAMSYYQKASDLDTAAGLPKVKMAAAFMDGLEQPMQGVMLLLDVIKKDSNNIDANLLLGKYGIISGQYGKAIARLEKVVSLQPENSEALFMLGEAYLNSGNQDKGIKCFEQSKKHVGSRELKEAIDSYIRQVKSGGGSHKKPS